MISRIHFRSHFVLMALLAALGCSAPKPYYFSWRTIKPDQHHLTRPIKDSLTRVSALSKYLPANELTASAGTNAPIEWQSARQIANKISVNTNQGETEKINRLTSIKQIQYDTVKTVAKKKGNGAAITSFISMLVGGGALLAAAATVWNPGLQLLAFLSFLIGILLIPRGLKSEKRGFAKASLYIIGLWLVILTIVAIAELASISS